MEKKSAPEGVSALQAQVAALTELLAVQEKVVGEQSARLEQALRERDELLNRQQQLIENLPACIFLKDSEMRYVAVNPAYHRLLPHGVEDPVGKRDRDVFPAKLANGFEEEDRKVLREGQTIRKEEPIRLRDGRVVQMSVSLSPVRGVDGTIVGLVGFAFDVTEHRRAEQALHESEEKFRKISSSALDAIIMMDDEGRVSYWNEAAERVFGYSESEVMGKDLHNTLAPPRYHEDYRRAQGRFHEVGQGGAVGKTIELFALRKDGTEFPIELSLSAVKMGGRWSALAVLRDITERKRMEEELRRAKEAAEAANRAKSEFLANMSHEIRTPMNAIIGMADLLWETPLTPEQHKYVQVFRGAGETLLGTINDILDFSKVEAGQIALETVDFDLRGEVEKVCEIMAIRAHEKGLELVSHLKPDVPTSLVGDPMRLRQILNNLIGNAIKFTQQGEVVVDVEGHAPETKAEEDSVEVKCSVRDTGIGIPSDRLGLLFQRFSQADTSITRRYGGSGLGLAISKRLVEMMGGVIRVESEVGKGSTFEFTARLRLQKEQKGLAPPARADLTGLKTLVVDDNATNRMILREMLAGWGPVVTEAADGSSALAELRRANAASAPYGLVLLDVRMPGLGGFEVAEIIKKDLALASMIIVMLPSDGRAGDITRCREMGLAGYLGKPIKKADLFEALVSSVGRQGPPRRSG